jgi:hypothetical protein
VWLAWTTTMKKHSLAPFLSDSSSIEHLATTCTQRVGGTIISSPDAITRMGIGTRLELCQLEHHEQHGDVALGGRLYTIVRSNELTSIW